jgi:hypothetical protein
VGEGEGGEEREMLAELHGGMVAKTGQSVAGFPGGQELPIGLFIGPIACPTNVPYLPAAPHGLAALIDTK